MDLGKINGIQEAVLDTVKMMFNEYTKNLNYDQTAVYTIYDDSEKDKGRYMVGETNDTVFTACSPNQQYKKGDKVYVTIPQGDSTQTKFIVSTYLDPAGSLNLDYRAPHAAIAPAEELNEEFVISGAAKTGGTDSPYMGLSQIPKVYYVPVSESQANFSRIENDFTRLYVGVEFNKQFGENDKPEYGIEICVVTSNAEVTEENIMINSGAEVLGTNSPERLIDILPEDFQVHTFKFFTNRMIGNLYHQGKSWQEDLIDITKLKNIVGIYFYLYLDSDDSNTSISVSRLAWKIGKDQQEMPNSLLSLYSANSLEYRDNELIKKIIYIRQGVIDPVTGLYYITSRLQPDPSSKIIYGVANSAIQQTNSILGPGWIEVFSGSLPSVSLSIKTAESIQECKAIKITKTENSDSQIESNSLVFYNINVDTKDRPVGTLYLKPYDGIYDHILYGLDGKINNIKEYEKFRKIQVSTVNKERQTKIPVAIHWYYPQENFMIQDMIYYNNSIHNYDLTNRYKQNLLDYEILQKITLSGDRGNSYTCIIDKQPNLDNLMGYAIDYYYNPNYTNNEIICRYYYSDTEFDEGRFTPKFNYLEAPQDDFEIVLSFVNNERPFIAYNPYGYITPNTETTSTGETIIKTVNYLPTGITWNVYSEFYPPLTPEEMCSGLKKEDGAFNYQIKSNEKYKVELVRSYIQDGNHNLFELHPTERYNEFYLFLPPEYETKSPEETVEVNINGVSTMKKIQGVIVNFEFVITDLTSKAIYLKNKKIAVPIKQESGENIHVQRNKMWDIGTVPYVRNHWYVEDNQLGALSQNQPAGLKCSSVFNYNAKGSVSSYSTSTLEAFGDFSTTLEYVLPTDKMDGTSSSFDGISLYNKNYMDTYKLQLNSPNNIGQFTTLTMHLGRRQSSMKDNLYYYDWYYGNWGEVSILKILDNNTFIGYYKKGSKTGGALTSKYWNDKELLYTTEPIKEGGYNEWLNTTMTFDRWNKLTYSTGSDKSISILPVIFTSSSYTVPNTLKIYSEKSAKFYDINLLKNGGSAFTIELAEGDKSYYHSTDGVNLNPAVIYFYELDEAIQDSGDTIRLVPIKSYSDISADSYIFTSDGSIVLKANAPELDSTEKCYYLESAISKSQSVSFKISSSSATVPNYAPAIKSRVGSNQTSTNEYLQPHALYVATEEVFYISAWDGNLLIWQQPIIIYGPNETPANTQEGEAIGLAAVASDGSAAGSISLGQQTSVLIQQLNKSSEATYGLITSDAQAPVFMLTEQGDVVMDLTHDSSNKIKQEIAIRPENLKIKHGEQLKSLDEYIKAIIQEMQ